MTNFTQHDKAAALDHLIDHVNSMLNSGSFEIPFVTIKNLDGKPELHFTMEFLADLLNAVDKSKLN